jgi:hypothetical protein
MTDAPALDDGEVLVAGNGHGARRYHTDADCQFVAKMANPMRRRLANLEADPLHDWQECAHCAGGYPRAQDHSLNKLLHTSDAGVLDDG